MDDDVLSLLTRKERLALAFFGAVNRRHKARFARLGDLVAASVIGGCTGLQADLYGVDRLSRLDPTRSILLACNHRSFFDQFVVGERLMRLGLPHHFFFPVRAPYFYETYGGILINLLLSGGAMYPPIFRDRERAALNQRALEELAAFLAQPASIVGIHPEGTRNKGPSPYELLPAQPGIGKVWLKAREHTQVLPVFITGLTNGVHLELLANVGLRPKPRIVIVFGEPLRDDAVAGLSENRPAHQKKAADRIAAAITALMPEEQAARAGGRLPDVRGWPRRRHRIELTPALPAADPAGPS